jgi:hypothetical protein
MKLGKSVKSTIAGSLWHPVEDVVRDSVRKSVRILVRNSVRDSSKY